MRTLQKKQKNTYKVSNAVRKYSVANTNKT